MNRKMNKCFFSWFMDFKLSRDEFDKFKALLMPYGAVEEVLTPKERYCLLHAKRAKLAECYHNGYWLTAEPSDTFCLCPYRLKSDAYYDDVYWQTSSGNRPREFNVTWTEGERPSVIVKDPSTTLPVYEAVRFSRGVPVFGDGSDEMQIVTSHGCEWEQNGWCPWYEDENGRPHKVQKVKAILSKGLKND